MIDKADLPEDPDAIWGSVHIAVDPTTQETHTHSDGSEHTQFAVTLRIENHGLPSDKFVDSLILAAITALKTSMTNDVFQDGVPDEVRDRMATLMAREYLKHKIAHDELPEADIAFAVPTFVDFDGGE